MTKEERLECIKNANTQLDGMESYILRLEEDMWDVRDPVLTTYYEFVGRYLASLRRLLDGLERCVDEY